MGMPSLNGSKLPKAAKWSLIAIGGLMAAKYVLLPVLAILAFAMNLVFTGVGILILVAIVYLLAKRRA